MSNKCGNAKEIGSPLSVGDKSRHRYAPGANPCLVPIMSEMSNKGVRLASSSNIVGQILHLMQDWYSMQPQNWNKDMAPIGQYITIVTPLTPLTIGKRDICIKH